MHQEVNATSNPQAAIDQARKNYRDVTTQLGHLGLDPAIPEGVRDLAEKTVARTREAYDRSMDAFDASGCRRSPEREFALRCRPWDFLRLPAMACSQSGSVAGEHKVMSYGPRHLHAKDLVYVWRGGCGLWAGSVSYLNIFATMGPPTRGFSSASSASALSFS